MALDYLSRTSMTGQHPEAIKAPMDFMLSLLLAAIVGFGLVAIYSASADFQSNTGGVYYLQRQLLALLISLFFMVMMMNMPITAVRWLARWGVVGALVLLCAVWLPGLGHKANGATRWIGHSGFYFQPAELTKLTFILFVADFVQRRPNIFRGKFVQQWPLLLMLAIMATLLHLQPDNGTIMVVMMVVVMMMIVAGMKVRVWMPIVVIFVVGVVLLYLFTPYVKVRFDSFLDPLKDPRGSSWQLINALIALGRGGWTGVGLGDSVQKTGYLPEVHTDFIFSMIGEELGFLGTSALIMLFALLVHRLFTLGRLANMRGDLFGAMCLYGIALWVGFQSVINMMVNTGWFPTKGLTLPFISYGSSSLMMLGCAMGVAFNIQRQTRVSTTIPSVFSPHPARAGHAS